jgi:hypothetical protein
MSLRRVLHLQNASLAQTLVMVGGARNAVSKFQWLETLLVRCRARMQATSYDNRILRANRINSIFRLQHRLISFVESSEAQHPGDQDRDVAG